MGLGSIVGSVVSAPFKLAESVAKGVTDVTVNTLKFVANTGFEAVKFGANMFQSLGPIGFLMNPMLALAAPLIGQAAGWGQNFTNQQLTDFNNTVQGREVPQSDQQAATANPQNAPINLPPFDQRYSQTGGWGGQYANGQIYNQFPAGTVPYAMPGGYAQTGYGAGPSPLTASPYVAGQSQAATSYAATANAGFVPTGDSTFDLANAIANAPTYSPTELALLSKIKDPEQRAIQELQMQMQKQALLCTVLTNLANMRHEMLKAVAQNLRS